MHSSVRNIEKSFIVRTWWFSVCILKSNLFEAVTEFWSLRSALKLFADDVRHHRGARSDMDGRAGLHHCIRLSLRHRRQWRGQFVWYFGRISRSFSATGFRTRMYIRDTRCCPARWANVFTTFIGKLDVGRACNYLPCNFYTSRVYVIYVVDQLFWVISLCN